MSKTTPEEAKALALKYSAVESNAVPGVLRIRTAALAALIDEVRATPPNATKGDEVSDAERDVLAERRRQISVERWTPEHDDDHAEGSLSEAAACYALEGTAARTGRGIDVMRTWPWEMKWWKPKDRRSNLVRAGALILAEVERFDRAAIRAAQKGGA